MACKVRHIVSSIVILILVLIVITLVSISTAGQAHQRAAVYTGFREYEEEESGTLDELEKRTTRSAAQGPVHHHEKKHSSTKMF